MAADSVGQIGLDLVVNQGDFKKQMSGIQSLAKKAGAALAGAFAVKKPVSYTHLDVYKRQGKTEDTG